MRQVTEMKWKKQTKHFMVIKFLISVLYISFDFAIISFSLFYLTIRLFAFDFYEVIYMIQPSASSTITSQKSRAHNPIANYDKISELVAQLRRENIELRTKLDQTEETLQV